jgi:hypothetical protein
LTRRNECNSITDIVITRPSEDRMLKCIRGRRLDLAPDAAAQNRDIVDGVP